MKTKKLILDDFQEEKIANSKMKKVFGGITEDMLNHQNDEPDDFGNGDIDWGTTGTGSSATNGNAKP
ncbi:hypothetical protein [Flavobacterium sp.]|uniref:hypothetical protein n=1 Tax=Flavobacterium sp. TaxID=239 RepID=UPI0026288F65|nr:hypothetical protein [Flavobacterium sp.]